MMQWVLSSSVLIAAVLLLRVVFQKRVSRRLMYAAWLIVAVRLLVPFSLCLPQASAVAVLPNAAAAQQYLASQAVQLPAFVAGTTDAGQLAAQATLPLSSVLKAVWLCGSAAVGVWLAGVNLRFARRLKRQRSPIAAQSKLPVYLVQNLRTPCLFGLVRPAIYITPQVLGDNARLNHVLAHETCHYQQGDHFFSLVRGACLAVHWFNPLVWVAAVCSRNDCELSCDERTLARLGDAQKLPYGHTLVDLAAVKMSPAVLLSAATSMASGAGQMKKRIRLIANGRKPIVAVAVLVLCLLLVAAGCSFLAGGTAPTNHTLLAQPEGHDPINLSITLPDGWTVRHPEPDEPIGLMGNYVSAGLLYDGDTCMGYVGIATFQPYTGGDLPPADYHKSVYTDLRLSSMLHLENYTPVARTETTEAALATLHYIAPELIQDDQGQLAAAPRTAVQCVLYYDTQAKAYAVVQLADGAAVTEQQRSSIASGISFS